MVDETTLLAKGCGSVVAPAGCGKTELIAVAAKASRGRPLLVLTHTHAGVRALRDRMKRHGVSDGTVRVETIAGWALRYAIAYPKGASLVTGDPIEEQWNGIYEGASALLDIHAIRDVVRASYSRLLVDEYQDCTRIQHTLVSKLGEILPACVLGDPLQGIFGFAGGELSWAEIQDAFPSRGELNEPWRWRHKNEPLGQWCLSIRNALIDGLPIDLSKAPLKLGRPDDKSQISQAHRVASLDGTAIAIRKWERDAHGYAKKLGGRYRSMEEIEGKSLRRFAAQMETLDGPGRAKRIVELAKECMTGVGAAIPTAVKALAAGKRPDSTRTKKNPEICEALGCVFDSPSPTAVHNALVQMGEMEGCNLSRSELWRDSLALFRELARIPNSALDQTVLALRSRHRAFGRGLDPRVVSRTLLIKGLEFDHALIPNVSEFNDKKRPSDGARHFYVAVSRGSRTLTILSETDEILFPPAEI